MAITWAEVRYRITKSLQQCLFIIFKFYSLLLKSSKPHANTDVQKEPLALSRLQKNADSQKELKLHLTLGAPFLISASPDSSPISVNNIFLPAKRVVLVFSLGYLHVILAGK